MSEQEEPKLRYPMLVDHLCQQDRDPNLRRLVDEAFACGRGSVQAELYKTRCDLADTAGRLRRVTIERDKLQADLQHTLNEFAAIDDMTADYGQFRSDKIQAELDALRAKLPEHEDTKRSFVPGVDDAYMMTQCGVRMVDRVRYQQGRFSFHSWRWTAPRAYSTGAACQQAEGDN